MLAKHKAAGGACYEVVDGLLTETVAGERRPMLAVDDLPGAFGGRAAHVVANALAAVAACRAAGISAKDIARGLAAFVPGADNPGPGQRVPGRDQPGDRRLRAQRGGAGGDWAAWSARSGPASRSLP